MIALILISVLMNFVARIYNNRRLDLYGDLCPYSGRIRSYRSANIAADRGTRNVVHVTPWCRKT